MSLQANAEGRVYDFSFQRKRAARPRAVKAVPAAVRTQAPVAKSATDTASAATASPTPPTVIAPITQPETLATIQPLPSEPAAQTTAVLAETTRTIKPRLWTLSLKAAEVIDRTANDTAAVIGVQRALTGEGLALDAQVWAPAGRRMDGSLGLVFAINTPVPRFHVIAQAGALTTPSSAARASFQAVRAYYGFGFGYDLSSALRLTGDVRLQDNSRFGSLAAGLAIRL